MSRQAQSDLVSQFAHHGTFQKIAMTEQGDLSLTLYNPRHGKLNLIASFGHKEPGFQILEQRPKAQPKPLGIIQYSRKYFLNRKIESCLVDPWHKCHGFLFKDIPTPEGQKRKKRERLPPNLFFFDFSSQPPRFSVGRWHDKTPEVYCQEGESLFFLESYQEYAQSFSRTKPRPLLSRQIPLTCVWPTYLETITKWKPENTEQASSEIQPREAPTQQALTDKNLLFPTHIRKGIKRKKQFLERRLKKQQGDIPQPEELYQIARQAEGLSASLWKWPEHQSSWHVPEELQAEYLLPPVLSCRQGEKPGDILNSLYHKKHKLEKRQSELKMRLLESQLAIDQFAQLVDQAQQTLTAKREELQQSLGDRFRESDLFFHVAQDIPISVGRLCHNIDVEWGEAKEKQKKSTQKKLSSLPYRTFLASTGEPIHVSKSSRDADAMLKLMPSHHSWLHILTGEGSHVWVEKPKKTQPSQQALREAGILAVHYSKLSQGMSGEVRIARRADVEKKKHLAPGKVLVRRCETEVFRYTDEEKNKILERRQH